MSAYLRISTHFLALILFALLYEGCVMTRIQPMSQPANSTQYNGTSSVHAMYYKGYKLLFTFPDEFSISESILVVTISDARTGLPVRDVCLGLTFTEEPTKPVKGKAQAEYSDTAVCSPRAASSEDGGYFFNPDITKNGDYELTLSIFCVGSEAFASPQIVKHHLRVVPFAELHPLPPDIYFNMANPIVIAGMGAVIATMVFMLHVF